MKLANSEVKLIIDKLSKKEISVLDIPEEYKHNIEIILFERKEGLRLCGKRGFDVISNSFFVKEELLYNDFLGQKQSKTIVESFDDFDSYYKYLDGNIYENSCYTFLKLSDEMISFYNLDINRMIEQKSFIVDTIDDYSITSSDEFEPNDNFSKCSIYEITKLPICADSDLLYNITKYYNNGKFYVIQQWKNKDEVLIKEYKHNFEYFFDFVAFLKGDLSNSDLLFCDGLVNLEKWNNIDFSGAILTSSLSKKFGIKYEQYKLQEELLESFQNIEQNENKTALLLQTQRDLDVEAQNRGLTSFELNFDIKSQRVDYISDIHLIHRIKNAKCQSKSDVFYVVQKIARTIASETRSLLLIAGDISSDFSIFKLFVKQLSKEVKKSRTTVIFTLGNHELWSFPEVPITEIVDKYRTLIESYGMYLLQNDLLYKEDSSFSEDSSEHIHLIKYSELCKMEDIQIRERLRSARFVIFGGIGFSGYNLEFNSNNGIYKNIITREKEIKETKNFELLYNRLYPLVKSKNSIVVTHMPKRDWCKNSEPDEDLIYVAGHTHQNYFYDDGTYRIYADNQIGYRGNNVHLKSILTDNDYDYFEDYSDGIYEITSSQYRDFYRGKNLSMTFQRKVNILYMLKRKGYYCFIHQSKSGNLTILNGGSMKSLSVKDIHYYYNNMDKMIDTIRKPLYKFSEFQNKIADIIKKIGGSGRIHGCIIDIDFENHIYVNPLDLTITGYWASSIINKIIYPSIQALLKDKCPAIYGQYQKLLKGDTKTSLVIRDQENISILPQKYLDTDIYRVSREIKKMQKLTSNILSSWSEEALPKNLLLK